MLVRELALVVDAGLEVPALVVVRRLAVAQGGLAAADDRDVGAVEGGISHVQARVVGPGGVLDGLVVTAGAGAFLGEGHIRIVTALDGGAQAFGDEVQLLGDGHVHAEGGLVLGLVSGPVVVLPAVPLREAVRQGVIGDDRDGHAVHDARGGRRMGPQHGQRPDVVAVAVQRLAGVADDAADVELHVRRLGELEVQVRAVVVPVVRVVVVVGDVRDLLEQTVLEHVTHGHEVADLVRTAGDVDVVLGLQEGLAEHQLVPVGVRVHDGVGTRPVGLEGLAGEVQARVRLAVVPLVHVVVPGEIVAVALLDVGHRRLETRDGAHGDLRLAGVAALGRHDDDAVRAAHAEHRRGGGVLQDGQAFDFIRVHGVQRTLDAVHQDERARVGVGQGAYAADVDLGVVFTRLAGLLDGGDARHLAGEDVGHVRHRRLHERLVVDGRERARDGRLGLGAVRDHDRGVQGLGVVPEHDRERALLAYRHRFGDVAQGRNLQHSSLTGDDKREVAIRIGSHTGGRPLEGDARTDHRQAVSVHHSTFDGNAPVLRGGDPSPQPQEEAQSGSQL